jgi:hypothetical protein
MRTRQNKARRKGLPTPPTPPKPPKLPSLRRGQAERPAMREPNPFFSDDLYRAQENGATLGQVRQEEIEGKSRREQDMSHYATPEDILGPLLSARILAQHPEIDKDDYLAFWTRNWQLEPNEDDRAAAEHIIKLIDELEEGK